MVWVRDRGAEPDAPSHVVSEVEESSYRVRTGDIEIDVLACGDPANDAVLLVHGWPDTAAVWRHQIPFLVAHGFRVLAPDARGMGRSDRPASVGDYAIHKVVDDIIAVLDDAGVERAHLIAHDWGAAAAWAAVIRRPTRFRSFTALSVGHPAAFRAAGMPQLQRSWYMLLFQFDDTAEELLTRNDWDLFRRFVGRHPETEAWIANLSGDGALTSSLNFYRANASPAQLLGPPLELPPVRVPTLGVWSSGDFALTEDQMERSGEHVEATWRYERFDDVSHWLQLDAPDRLNTLLADWLSTV